MRNKDIASMILRKCWYLICIPFLIIFGLITLPLTLLFKWNGFWILVVAHHENCSLSEAKRLFLENKDGKYTVTYGPTLNSNISHDLTSTNSKLSYNNDIVSSTAYSSFPCNIHYRNF